MTNEYVITGLKYNDNKNPALTTQNDFMWGYLNKLISDHRLFFKDERGEVTNAHYETILGFTTKNPGLGNAIKPDTVEKLEEAIKGRKLYMIDAPIRYSTYTDSSINNPKAFTNDGNWHGGGGTRNKSRKPKRRNSRSKRRKTLNKSRH